MAIPDIAKGSAVLLQDLGDSLELWRVHPMLLQEQSKNARVQSPSTFKNLVRNIQNRGALESVPFVSRQGEEFFILSGHHRVRAAIQAEIQSIVVLADSRTMSRSEVVAKQLSHNAISGKDDPSVLLQLLAEIEDVQAMIESSVDKAALEAMVKQNVSMPDIKVDYDWKVLQLTFLPTQVKDLESLADLVGGADLVGVADAKIFEDFVGTMKRLGKCEDIRSIGALLYRMMEITKAHLATVEPAKEPAVEKADG